MAWFDAHCHLSSPRWEGRLESILDKARAAGVSRWALGGWDPEDWERQLELKRSLPVVTAFGLHPWWAAEQTEQALERGLRLLEERLPRADALGELGLDRSPRRSAGVSMALQRRAFDGQLELAERFQKPLVLHVVRAHGEVLEALEGRRGLKGGVVHSFSGSLETARRYVKLGFLISVGPSAARGHESLKAALPGLPPEALAVESDESEPEALLDAARLAAERRGESAETVLDRGTRNLERIFGEPR